MRSVSLDLRARLIMELQIIKVHPIFKSLKNIRILKIKHLTKPIEYHYFYTTAMILEDQESKISSIEISLMLY